MCSIKQIKSKIDLSWKNCGWSGNLQEFGVWNKGHELIQFACFVYKSVTTAEQLVQVLASKSKCTSHDNKLFI